MHRDELRGLAQHAAVLGEVCRVQAVSGAEVGGRLAARPELVNKLLPLRGIASPSGHGSSSR